MRSRAIDRSMGHTFLSFDQPRSCRTCFCGNHRRRLSTGRLLIEWPEVLVGTREYEEREKKINVHRVQGRRRGGVVNRRKDGYFATPGGTSARTRCDFTGSENCPKITAKSDILFLSQARPAAFERSLGIFMGFYELATPLFRGGGGAARGRTRVLVHLAGFTTIQCQGR